MATGDRKSQHPRATSLLIDVSPGRRWLLRLAYLIIAAGLTAINLPDLIDADLAGRGVITSFLGGMWLMAFVGLRYPAQMLPLLLLEFAWKLIWTLRFGLPQYAGGDRPPTWAMDFPAILFGVVLMLFVIPWRSVARAFTNLPPLRRFGFDAAVEAGEAGVPEWRIRLLRGLCLLVILAWSSDIVTAMTEPANNRGVFASMIAALYLLVFLMYRAPMLMIPVMLFEIVWKLVWLTVFGVPKWLAGIADPQFAEDLFSVGAIPFVIALFLPWGFVWRTYVLKPTEPWR